jgi:hypothetical protein
VEPTTPCETKTYEEEETFKEPSINGRSILIGRGSSGNSIKSITSTSSSQVYTLHGGGSTTNFTMEGADPTIWLP